MDAPDARADRRAATLAAVALVGLTSVAMLAAAGAELSLREFPLDDAWIHQVYVRSLVRDAALAYNPGTPEAGFSSLLWLVACVPAQLAALVGAPLALCVRITSVLCAMAAAAGLGRVALALGGSRRAALATVALAALSWGGAFAAVSAMECGLALACGAWAIAAHLERRPLVTGAWLAAACLARPECVALAGVVGLDALSLSSPRRAVRVLSTLAPVGVACALWAAVTWSRTGHPLPNTFYVKAQHIALAANVPVFLREVLWGDGLPQALLAAPLALWGLRACASRREAWLVAAAAVVGVAAVATSRPLFAGVTFFQLRYFLPFSTLAVPLAGVGFAALEEKLSAVAARRGLALAVAAYLVACVAPALRSHRVHCEEIRALHTEVALDVARLVPPGVVVAVEAAGAMRYLGAHRVVDLYGLNYAPVAFAPSNRARTCAIAREHPALVAVPPWWEPRLRPAFELRPLRLYRVPESAIIRGGGGRAVVLYAATLRESIAARCGLSGAR